MFMLIMLILIIGLFAKIGLSYFGIFVAWNDLFSYTALGIVSLWASIHIAREIGNLRKGNLHENENKS